MGRNARSGGFNIGYVCLELDEGTVQAIFNRCRATQGTDVLSSILFPQVLGYSDRKKYHPIDFNKTNILDNRLNIQYLFGQLNSVHTSKKLLTMDDFFKNYCGQNWTSDKSALMELLYLGKCSGIDLIHPFDARKNNTTRFASAIKPTLSPKDPNFPAWWEAHKGEWEQ